jgi:acyl dehydratase
MAADGTELPHSPLDRLRIGRRRSDPLPLALHRPGPVPAMNHWTGRTAEGDRRQAVADGAESHDEVLKKIIGQPTGTAKVIVERGPVQHFADAVLSTSPIYHNPEAAKAAGFDAIPAPPTFPFAMEFSGKFDELQPADAPTSNPLGAAVGPLMAKGGLILHGEQEFVYHRPVQVGDVLVSEGRITDAYQKESKGRTMTFIIQETNWRDDKTGEPVVTTRFNLIHRA